MAKPSPEPPPPDWVAPRATLILAASPRSGSSWLASLVESTDRLGRPHEWFGPWRTGGTRERTIAAAREAAEIGATANGIAGIKLFPHHLAAAQPHLDLFRWFPGTVWVHLTRRDLLGQAISMWRADASGQWKQPAASAGPAPAVAYAAEPIDAFLRKCAAYDADWRAFFARTGIEPVTAVYEDLVADPDRLLRSVAERMGVALPPGPIGDPRPSQVQRDMYSVAARAKYRSERGDPDHRLNLLLAAPTTVVAPRTAGNLLRFLTGRPLRL